MGGTCCTSRQEKKAHCRRHGNTCQLIPLGIVGKRVSLCRMSAIEFQKGRQSGVSYCVCRNVQSYVRRARLGMRMVVCTKSQSQIQSLKCPSHGTLNHKGPSTVPERANRLSLARRTDKMLFVSATTKGPPLEPGTATRANQHAQPV